jgi:hypothetical protein
MKQSGCAAALTVALLCLPGAVLARGGKIVSSIVVNPQCPQPCPVRDLRGGRLTIVSAGFPDGASFRIQIRGLEQDPASGIPGPLDARIDLSLSFGGLPCETFQSPTFTLSPKGRLSAKFSRTELIPVPEQSLGSLSLCGASIVHPGVGAYGAAGVLMGSAQ